MTTPTTPENSPEVSVPSFKIPLFVSLGIAAGLAGLSLWARTRLPDGARIPIHWNAAGNVDRYGGPSALFMLPGLIFFVSVLLSVVPRIEPRRSHFARSARAYRWVWLTIVLFLALLHVLTVEAALGRPVAMDRWVSGGIGLLFLVMGNFLGKVRSNFMFGVRTPWTLSSELSWNRTHRLAGWLFVIGGAVLLVGSVGGLRGKPLAFVLLGWIGLTVIASATYSYWVWRHDPDRRAG